MATITEDYVSFETAKLLKLSIIMNCIALKTNLFVLCATFIKVNLGIAANKLVKQQ
jgi:hypothetical protein